MDSSVLWKVLALACLSYFADGKAFLENYGSDAHEGDAAVSHWGYGPEAYSYELPYSQHGAYSSLQGQAQHYEPYVDGSLIFVPDAQQPFAGTEDSADYSEDSEYGSIMNVQHPFEEVGATSGQDLEDDYDYMLEGDSLSKKDKTKSKPKEKNKEMNYSPETKRKTEKNRIKDREEKENLDKDKGKKPHNDEIEQDYKPQVVKTKPEKPIKESTEKDKSNSKDSYSTPFSIEVNESTEEFDEPPDMDPLTKKKKEKVKPPHVKIENEKAKPSQKNVKPEPVKIDEYYKNEAKPTEKTKYPDSKGQAGNTKTEPYKEDYKNSTVIKPNTKEKTDKNQTIGKHGSKKPQKDYTESDIPKKEPEIKPVKMEKYDGAVEIQKSKESFSSLNTDIEDQESEIKPEENVDRIIKSKEKAEIEHVLELLNPEEQSGRFLSALNSNLWSLIFNQNAQLQKFKKCVTRNNETGSCMNLQFCSIPNMASSLEQLLNNACVINDIFIGVCCPDFPVESVKVDWGQSVEVQDNMELSSNVNDCGERSVKAVEAHAWPWKAPLLAKSNGKIFCGGVLINKRYVLTAAHCTTKIPRNQILVRLGEHSSSSGEDVPVMEIKRHAQYNPRTMQDDIALLKLARSVKLAHFVGLVCLPEFDDDDDFDDNYEGAEALLLGWHGIRPDQMKEKDESLTVMNQTTCKNQLGVAISESILCTDARNENERTCNADSGAPLTVEVDGKYEVLGVLSWNRNDCDPRFPSTFSSVPHYRKWILKHSN